MLKSVMKKSEWAKVEPAWNRQGKQYYFLRIDPVEEGENIISLEEVYDHEPTKDDESTLRAKYLRICKDVAKHRAEQYAKTDAVKSFSIENAKGWIDSEQRVSIRQAATDKVAAGREKFNLVFGGVVFETTPAKVVEIMTAVEIYASDCYDATEAHKAAIELLTTEKECEEYDHAAGYPEQPSFTL